MNRENVIETYTWRTVKNRREELLAGDTPIGGLAWRGWFSVQATGAVAGNEWVMDRPGFFRQRIEIRPAGAAEPEALFEPRWTGTSGTLHLSGGRTYGWKSTSFWGTRWQWQNTSGAPVMRFHHHGGFFRQRATVELLDLNIESRERALLLLLGWYLISLHNMDSAAVVAAAG